MGTRTRAELCRLAHNVAMGGVMNLFVTRGIEPPADLDQEVPNLLDAIFAASLPDEGAEEM
jgi:hypothetical protein